MFTDYINIEINLALYYLVDFVIAVMLLSGMRYLAGVVGNVSATEELSQKDNKAFGVSLAGGIVSISIMLTGVVSGDAGYNLGNEAALVLMFGLIGIALMWVTRKLFDHISFPSLSIHDEIMRGNMSASIIDACNMIATAIIIKGAMTWVDGSVTTSILAILISFVAAQLILVLATLYRAKVYERRHNGRQLHTAIENDNVALALRFSAFRIGIAIAVSSAFTAIEYVPEEFTMVFMLWFAFAVGLFVLLILVAIVIRHAVLHRVNIAEEVGQQANIAVGVIEGSIYIVVGLLLAGLVGA